MKPSRQQITDFLEKKKIAVAGVSRDQCILMHTESVNGFHKFHRMIKQIFGFAAEIILA